MLQLSRIELEAELRTEMQENPLLEENTQFEEEDVKVHEEAEQEAQIDMQDPRDQDEFDWEKYLESVQPSSSSHTFSDAETGESKNYENLISTGQSLQDYLIWQIQVSYVENEERKHMELLVDYINNDGYLEDSLESITAKKGIPTRDLLKALETIHQMDPPGIGARNLEECLTLQVYYLQKDAEDLIYLIKNHLKDLEKKEYGKIARSMNLNEEEVMDLCKVITSMNPRPGSVYHVPDTHYVLPDIYIRKVEDEYMVSMNENGLPKLKISNLYRKIIKQKQVHGEVKSYMKDKLRSALWLIKSLHQRQRTIYKVAESIVRHQRSFLDKGEEHIKPMILQDVARDIEMHASTVSRVTNGKYANTPQGVFELKYFFNKGLRRQDGDDLSSTSVRMKITQLVGKENPEKPLSDNALFKLLREEGIDVARRTVTKYRQTLKIPTSGQRKRRLKG